jgi:hypothetical protein
MGFSHPVLFEYYSLLKGFDYVKYFKTMYYNVLNNYHFNWLYSLFNVWLLFTLTTGMSFYSSIVSLFYTIPFKISDTVWGINYLYNNKLYTITFPISKVPDTSIIKVNTEKEDTNIHKYLGPNNDFHGAKLTPKLMGYKSITITYFRGEDLETKTKTFGEDEVISLN